MMLPPWLWFVRGAFWCAAVAGLMMIPSALANLANSQTVLHAAFVAFLK